MREQSPDLAASADRGELPSIGWKGGLQELPDGRAYTIKKKIGTLWYLAQWQGLRGEDLNIDLKSEPTIECSRYGVAVTFTLDYERYKNAG